MPPVKREVQILTNAAVANLFALNELIQEHRHDSIIIGSWNGVDREVLLANSGYSFPTTLLKEPIAEDATRLPLREMWEDWVEKRPTEFLDDDGLELLRAQLMLQRHNYEQSWPATWAALHSEDKSKPKLKYGHVIGSILAWLVRLYPAPNTADFLLDCIDTVWADIPEKTLRGVHDHETRRINRLNDMAYSYAAHHYRNDADAVWEDRHDIRLWGLSRWMDEPVPNVPRFHPDLEDTLIAHKLNVATVDDIYDQLLGPRNARGIHAQFSDFGQLSDRKSPHTAKLFQEYPSLTEIFERCRQRVLEVELNRGDMPTEATDAAGALRHVPGIAWFIRILQALGKKYRANVVDTAAPKPSATCSMCRAHQIMKHSSTFPNP